MHFPTQISQNPFSAGAPRIPLGSYNFFQTP